MAEHARVGLDHTPRGVTVFPNNGREDIQLPAIVEDEFGHLEASWIPTVRMLNRCGPTYRPEIVPTIKRIHAGAALNQQPGNFQVSPFGRPMQWDRFTTTFAGHDILPGVKQRLHDLEEPAVRGAVKWGSPEVGVSRVNLRRVRLENAANQRHIATTSSRDQIVARMHHCLPEDGAPSGSP